MESIAIAIIGTLSAGLSAAIMSAARMSEYRKKHAICLRQSQSLPIRLLIQQRRNIQSHNCMLAKKNPLIRTVTA